MAQDEVHKLKQLIQAAADDKHMPEADLIVLDDQKLGLLAQNDLITPVILCDTTEEQFAQVVGTLGAAKVLKMLFPDKGQAGSAQPMTVPPDVVAARARTASRYVNFMLGDDGKPHAVVTLDQRRLITYGHGGHGQLREGSTVQVYLNNPEDDKPAPAKATVKFIKTQLDLVILEVDRELDPPPLDADVHPGEPYIMLAYSTTSASSRQEFGKPLPEDHASVSHGSIATSVPDKNGCIRGDTPPSPGDSGGGVFSLETGKLLGMCIGREKIKGRHGQYKDGFKSVLVPVAGVLMLLS